MNETLTTAQTAFGKDVDNGLSSTPKYLSSKYFYDKYGDRIFQNIMQMPEYYLTDCELEIFRQEKEQIIDSLGFGDEKFALIEFGAGDGMKTSVLMEYLQDRKRDFKFIPVDISSNVLDILCTDLRKKYPHLDMLPVHNEYFKGLEKINSMARMKKLVLFIGSNIGNFLRDEAIEFLSRMWYLLDPGDKVLIGFDLKKDPTVIAAAYDDAGGHTKAFNLNLLLRINRELGGKFKVEQFDHFPTYDPKTGAAKSHLISKVNQEVDILALNKSFHFLAGELIFTEISQKYDEEMIEDLAVSAGFSVCGHFYDRRRYFLDSLWCRE